VRARACGDERVRRNFAICTFPALAPLASKSAPIVVDVVATRTPGEPANGSNYAISLKSEAISCIIALRKYIAGFPCSAVPVEKTLMVPAPVS